MGLKGCKKWIIFPLIISFPALSKEDEIYLELLKKLNVGNIISVKSDIKFATNPVPIIFVTTHGYTLYSVDIKDGVMMFYPGSGYGSFLWKTYTDSVGSIIIKENNSRENLFITTVNGEIFYGGKWSKRIESSIFCAPSAYDLNEDGDVEVLVGDDNGAIHIFNLKGEEILKITNIRGMITSPPLYLKNRGKEGKIYAGASDGKLYAISLTGAILWRLSTPYEIYSSPVAGDLDGDGEREIVFANIGGEIYRVNENGEYKKLFTAGFWIEANPALGDLNNDGKAEIIVGSWDNNIYALNSQGEVLWKYDTGSDVRTTPLIADIDGNGTQEVLVTTENGKILVFSHKGEILLEKRVTTGFLGQPSIFDVDDDGKYEVIVGGGDRNLYIYKTPNKGDAHWPFFRKDLLNSGVF